MASDLFNRVIRHQIGLERAKAGEAKKMLKLVKGNDEQIINLIQSLPEDYTLNQLNRVLRKIKNLNRNYYRTFVKSAMNEISKNTVEMEIPFSVKNVDQFLNPDSEKINFPTEKEVLAIGNSRKYQGKKLETWVDSLADDKTNRIVKNLKIKAIDEEEVSKLISTAKRQIKISNNNVSTISKIHVDHFSNISRDEVYSSNDDKVKEIIWSSILDSGTTVTCGVRSNKRYDAKTKEPIGHNNDWGGGPGRIHYACRSAGVPTDEDGIITSGSGEGFRYDQGTKTAIGGNEDYERGDNETLSGHRAKLPNDHNELEKQLVPASTDYEKWMKKQPRDFVEDSLGVGKAKAFLDDNVPLESFVVDDGRELTLKQFNEQG